MLETFKVRLKAKAKAAGANLSQKRIDALADRLHKKFPDLTEEADHDEKLDDYYDADELKGIAAGDDKIRTLETQNRGQQNQNGNQQQQSSEGTQQGGNAQQQQQAKDDDVPAWAKTMLTELQTLKADKAKSTMQEKLAANDGLKDIPKSFLKGRPLPEKDEYIEAYVNDAKADYAALQTEMGQQQQEGNDNNFSQAPKPPGSAGGGGKKVVDPVFAEKPKPATATK